MPDQPVSRRTVAFAIAGSVVGAKLIESVPAVASPEAPLDSAQPAETDAGQDPSARDRSAGEREHALLAPLQVGSRLAEWRVSAIEPLTLGCMKVELAGPNQRFAVEVLARDTSVLASNPPGLTEKFAFYVSNGGDGRKPTAEEQGLAAMALAQVVARNEVHVSAEGFLSHAERIARHQTALLTHVDGSAPDLSLVAPAVKEAPRWAAPSRLRPAVSHRHGRA